MTIKNYILSQTFTFDASHNLPNYIGACHNLHGHRFKVKVSINNVINPETGMVIDFKIVKDIINSVINKLDHTHLNDTIKNPTAEHIAAYLWKELEGKLKFLYELEIWETENSSVKIGVEWGF